MKFQHLPLLFLPAALGACGSGSTTPADATKPLTPAQQQAKIEQIKLHFNDPVSIDNSVYVLYPLLLRSTEAEEDMDSSIGSKSYGRSNLYWNIAFYNTETGESHLLSADKKVIVYSYSEAASGRETTDVAAADCAEPAQAGTSQLDKLMYYAVRTDDFNQDGELNEKDPMYLFTSDKAGKDFKQISPPNYHVETWHLVRGTNKILIQGTPDSDNNRKFDDRDVTTPLVYSVQPDGPARPVFSEPFNTSVKQLLHAQWAKKP